MAKPSEQYQTVRTEGALLPSDILQTIAALKVEGVSPENYHLPPGTKLNEAIAHSWSLLQKHWKAFQERRVQLDPAKPGTEITNQHWLLPLFEQLGYGRLTTSKAPEIDGRTYPIERFYSQQPIHLIGCNLPLDRRTSGARGASTSGPHSMVQEFLNRHEQSTWGFLSNGLVLRILRDNISLSRQAYVEFNLEAMMSGEVYADFALLWMLCHQSRIEGNQPSDFWLEKWSKLAREQGTRVLDDLRVGVTNAIEALGRGFIAHPKNDRLRDKLRSGALSTQDYYRQLLRIVYRLLFLFVAEGRGLLHPSETGQDACQLYDEFYSTARLRELSHSIRGSKHGDLWYNLSLVFDALGTAAGLPQLGLPALGSFLWRRSSTADLVGLAAKTMPPADEPVHITNDDLLSAVRALAYVQQDKVLRDVDYRNLGSEELGSVYESLLELHPQINIEGRTFSLSVAAGHERKTTGSYYTPDSLVQCLLDSALEPVVAERIKGLKADEAEKAILNLKICDPACGSGHFLIAAAHRLARHLARVRTGESEPSPEDHQHALRDIIGRSIYGVDLNPMAVELCKVSLWIEALEPGKPLSFLDHHIQVGNSLLGTTPALLAGGIPDGAFTPIEGDVKKRVTELKKRNKKEREDYANRQGYLFDPPIKLGNLAAELARIDEASDETQQGIAEKERRYAEFVKCSDYQFGHLLADTWCAAFLWKKDDSELGQLCPTERDFRKVESHGAPGLLPHVRAEVERLRDQYQFFHWHLAFPDVFHIASGEQPTVNGKDGSSDHLPFATNHSPTTGWSGGFDVMLGNPPWETLSPDAKEFFSTYDPQVRFQDRDGQKQIIESLLADPVIAGRWEESCRDLYSLVHFIKQSGRFRMFAPGNLGKGDFNVYRMFVEAALSLACRGGWAAQLVPEGLYNGANCMAIRQALYETCRLDCLYGFENTNEAWFPGVHTAMKFCLYAAHVGDTTDTFRAAFNIRSIAGLADVKSGRYLLMPVRLVREFSPDALAIMELGNQMDIDIAAKMYRWPAFGDESADPPTREYMAEVHMGNNRDLFNEDGDGLPVYEGRMVGQFDHRAKGYQSGRGRAAEWKDYQHSDPCKSVRPQWYISNAKLPSKVVPRAGQFRVGHCAVGSPTNERTLIACLIPPNSVCGHSVLTLLFEPHGYEWYLPFWIAVANSFAMDFVIRSKVALNITITIMDSLPFPRPEAVDERAHEVVERAMRLICTAPEMVPFWNRLAAYGWVTATDNPTQIPGETSEDARLQLRAEIDAIVARDLFDLTRLELEYILSTFPTQQRYQEEQYGEFRSRRLILEAYDKLPLFRPSATKGAAI